MCFAITVGGTRSTILAFLAMLLVWPRKAWYGARSCQKL